MLLKKNNLCIESTYLSSISTFRHPGTPKHLLSPSHKAFQPGNGDLPDTASIVLGLRTLGTFDFEGHSLLQFVRHCADNYLHSEEKLIRLEAVRTCSALLKGTLLGLTGRKSSAVQSTVNEVLAKLLVIRNRTSFII